MRVSNDMGKTFGPLLKLFAILGALLTGGISIAVGLGSNVAEAGRAFN